MHIYVLENYLDTSELYKYIYKIDSNHAVSTILNKIKISPYINYGNDTINIYYKSVSGVSFIGGYDRQTGNSLCLQINDIGSSTMPV